MRRTALLVIAATFMAAVSASAQEHPGAGRVDVTIAPVGAMFFTDSGRASETDFGDYALAVAATFNIHPRFAVEGEFGDAVGVHQNITTNGGSLFNNQSSPCMYQYSASLIVHPIRSDRSFAPYVAGGVGGLTMLGTDEVRPLGISRNSTYLTGNMGGGLKWFVARRWGVRADYRLFAIRDNATAPAFFARDGVRYAHRVYGGLLLNY